MIELCSDTDGLTPIQEKMQEFKNPLRLGWLINPQARQVEIYRLLKAVEVVQIPAIISGEDIFPGFELQVSVGNKRDGYDVG